MPSPVKTTANTHTPATPGSARNSPASRHLLLEQRREIGRDFLIGLVCVVVLIGLKLWFGNSAPGRQFDLSAYNLIQQRLASASAPENAVRVVSIGDLSPRANPTSISDQTETPRNKLRILITAVVSQRPAAIGIDVDFSPDSDSKSVYVDAGDPFFFNFCRRQGVPIFLGVKRTIRQQPDAWLGVASYRPLAASLAGPPGDPRYYFASTTVAGADEPLPTLATRLFPYVGTRTRLPWPHWMAEQVGADKPVDESMPFDRALLGRKFSVDYSQLDALITQGKKTPSAQVALNPATAAQHIPLSAPCGPTDSPLCGKVVLIGDAEAADGTDNFLLLGRLVPGVYIHACATYTLSRLPLYDLTLVGQVALDLLFSVPVLIVLAWLRANAPRLWKRRLAVEPVQSAAVWLTVVLVVFLGVGLVERTRLMWDDFVLVIFALFLHPVVHRQIKAISSPRTWRPGSLVFEKKEEP